MLRRPLALFPPPESALQIGETGRRLSDRNVFLPNPNPTFSCKTGRAEAKRGGGWAHLVEPLEEGRLCWPAGKRSLTVCAAVSFDPVRPRLSCHHSALPPNLPCLPACLPACLHRPLARRCEAILVTKHYAGRGHSSPPPFPPWLSGRSQRSRPAAAGSLRPAGRNLLS